MENLILDAGETLNECDYRDHLAPKWKRFVNFLIDFYGIQLLFGFGYGLLIATGLVERPGRLMLILYSWGTIFILYLILELYTGKTLGKLITGTRVVSIEDGNLTATAIF